MGFNPCMAAMPAELLGSSSSSRPTCDGNQPRLPAPTWGAAAGSGTPTASTCLPRPYWNGTSCSFAGAVPKSKSAYRLQAVLAFTAELLSITRTPA